MPTWVTKKYDELAEGQELASVTFPITLRDLMIDVSGTRDLNPVHHDREYAKRNNSRDIFVNTMFYQSLFGRLITDSCGPEVFLRKLRFTMRQPNCLGDTITSRTWITKKYEQDGEKLIDVESHLDNQITPDATIAYMTVQIP